MDAIKVYHVEDYKVMREGIRHLLSLYRDMEVAGDAKNAEDFLKALETTDIDVLILDIYLDAMEDFNAMNGFQICRLVQDKYPHIKIVAHSIYDDADRVAAILKSGALGFVSKKSGFDEIMNAIRRVNVGERYICPVTTGKLKNLNQFLLGMDQNLRDKDEVFSHREKAVLNLISEGRSSKEIADTLFITERTVESHRKNMMDKAKVKNTAELIAYAFSVGVVKK